MSAGRIEAGGPPGGDAREALPVLLWLHGGANTFGSSAQPEHNGQALADLGLVVVTCNFRIGFEGFGYVEGAPHNRAVLDVRAALKWIQHRIAGFGGDPDNVTVAGHSAGAQLVACLLHDPVDFHKAIIHSMPGRFFTEEAARTIAQRIDASTPESAVRTGDAITENVLKEPLYQPIALPPHDITVPLLTCHTTEEDRELFQEPTKRLGGYQATYPGDHGDDVPDMFTTSEVSRAWAKFARTGSPGWVRSEVCRLNGSRSAR